MVDTISARYNASEHQHRTLTHIPATYLFVPVEGPVILQGSYGETPGVDTVHTARPLSFFDGAGELAEGARLLADDIVRYLDEIGTDNRRIAVEYVNPSIIQALLQRGLEVIDSVQGSEHARVIKSPDEIACIRWAIAVAEHGIAKMKEALQPGIMEVQLWALLNYANLANNEDWQDGRMLASGPRINPWYQEATMRQVEPGDLVGFDTDMIGSFGYFADISRTFHCGPGRPTKTQKALYRRAVAEIDYNLTLVRPGISLREFQARASVQPEEFHENAYTCLIHGVGMCDEYPRVNPVFRGPTRYDDTLSEGMMICVESHVGAVGDTDGGKLEQQVLVIGDGHELLTNYPYEDGLLN